MYSAERSRRRAVRVRPVREADRDRLREIFLVSRRHAFHWLTGKRYALGDFDTATRGEAIFVAEHPSTVIGFASVWEPGSFVHNLFVDPEWLGCGAGRALLDACARAFPPPLSLKCLKRNEAALAFYRRLGWTIEDDGEGADGEYYELFLR
jgi:GNAT superfamily N-acetyltransferase